MFLFVCADAIKKFTGRQLVVPNATCRNSTFDAVKCLQELDTDALDKTCDSVELPRFLSKDLEFIKEFVLVSFILLP